MTREAPKRRGRKPHDEKSYSSAERMGIMMLAVQEGVPHTAEKFKMPERTIYSWFREEGGIAEVRAYVESKASASFMRAIDAACNEVVKRLANATDEQVMVTFRKMLEVGTTDKLYQREPADEAGGSRKIVFQVLEAPTGEEAQRKPRKRNGKRNGKQDDPIEGEFEEVEDAFD